MTAVTGPETTRLRFEPFAERHLSERYVAWLNDPVVVRYSQQRFRAHTLDSCRRYAAGFAGSPSRLYALVARDLDRHIGNLTIGVEPNDRVASVDILIGERDLWGKGYGAEAFSAACDFALGSFGMRKVFTGTMAVNAPMLKLMAAARLVEEARFARHYLWEGREIDKVFAARYAP